MSLCLSVFVKLRQTIWFMVGCWLQTGENNQGRASNCRISVWYRSLERADSRCSGNRSVW